MIAATIAGILLPSLLLTAAMKRWIAPVPWRIALLFLAMTFVFLHGAVFTSKLPVPVDEVVRGDPYRAVVGPVSPRNPLTNDTVKLFLPWMEVAREELFAGRAPLWNRYSFSGYPLLANGESAPFSPLFLATLFVPLPKQIVATAGLKLFAALLFGYLFAKRYVKTDAAACFAATAFAFSVYQTVVLYYSAASVSAFLPTALFALFYAQEGGRHGVTLVALVVATLLANGHPESVLHIAIGAAGLMFIDFLLAADKRGWLWRFRAPLFGALCGLALSAPTWVPVLQQVPLSTRYADLQRLGGHGTDFPLTAIWAMVAPNGFGNPARGNWGWILNYTVVATSYVGLVVLALAGTAALSPRATLRQRLWLAFAILLWLIAMNWTFVGHAVNELFSIVANDKLRFVALFIGAIVAAETVEHLQERRSLVLIVAAAPLLWYALVAYRVQAQRLTRADLIGIVALLAVVAVALLARRTVAVAAFIATAAELFVFNTGFNALVDGRYYKPSLPIVEALRREAPQTPFRVVGREWVFLPNASAHYGLEDIRGSDPMSYDAYTEYLKQRITLDDRSIDVDRVVNVDHDSLDFLNVEFLIAEPGAAAPGARWRPVYSGADGTLFRNQQAKPRFFGKAAIGVSQRSPSRFVLQVEARAHALIASSQPLAPGWRVLVDGRRTAIEPVETAFLGFRVPAGSHTVEVVYRPRAYWWSLAGVVAGLLGMVWAGRSLSAVPAKGALLFQ